MAALTGAQRKILQAITDLDKDESGHVTDLALSRKTQMRLEDLHDWIETLQDKELLEVIRTEVGFIVSISALGRLVLRQTRPQPMPLISSQHNSRSNPLGILNFFYLDVSGIKGSSEQIPSTVNELSAEAKIHLLFDHLFGAGGFQYSDIETVTRACQEDGSQYAILREKFDMPQFYINRNGVGLANESGYLEFEIGEYMDDREDPFSVLKYDHSDSYYKAKKKPKIIFSASLLKFTNIGEGYMSPAGHDAIFFRGFAGREVPVGVFGQISPNNGYFSMKPFALWR